MKIKRKPEPENKPLEYVKRESSDPLFCEWSSHTHNRCHKLADPGLPFCEFHSAAALGMARGASYPDPDTRAKFDRVWEHYADAEVEQEGRL